MSERIDFLTPVTGRYFLALAAAAIVAWIAIRVTSGNANRLAKTWPIYVLRLGLVASLLSLLLNPVRVTEQMGAIEPSQVFFLLDASESMAIGNEDATRWDQAVDLISTATTKAFESAATEVSLFRFGRRLKAIRSPDDMGLDGALTTDGHGVTFVQKDQEQEPTDEERATLDVEASPANEPDTQMFVALRQISSRFGRKPPSAVVVFSDGRARDEGQAESVAAAFSQLGVPVHVVPVGNTESGGDVALVSLVMPISARKQSEVHAQAFLRSYGFDGTQVELKLNQLDENGRPFRRLATIPVTLQSGFQSVPISFRTSAETQLLEAVVSSLPNEVSTDNNRFETEIMISREKIRVLYVEGSRMRSVPTTLQGRMVLQGPDASLRNALQEDDDIECRTVQVAVSQLSGSTNSQLGSFPQSVAELSAFDAIVLSDVPRRTFSEKQLDWIEGWVKRRGGGLCMVGGRNSFGSGEWQNSPVGRMLPVEMQSDSDWRGDVRLAVLPDTNGQTHPLFRFTLDEKLNRDLLGQFPGFHGANTGLTPKPNLAKVLAVAQPGSLEAEKRQRSSLFSAQGIRDLFLQSRTSEPTGELPAEFAAITVGQYGKGRTMAMPVAITGSAADNFLTWGRLEGENQYYAQFWRNAIYWLTEQSYIGRRRLVASADKRYYGPGDTITLTGSAFDESANETSSYRLVGVIEPQSFDDIESDYSIVRWPNNLAREEEADSPFVIWGEEFEIPVRKQGSRDLYEIELTLAEALPSGTANQSLRLELTAYEDYTQVDSTSVPIQILHDPFEQQNPFPHHELLESLADASGGRVLADTDELANMLTSLPVVRGPSELTRAPVWSKWWAMAGIIGLISTEWCYRRWIGLA